MKRTIKSFVMRTGRVSPRQERGLEQVSNYQLYLAPWTLTAIFERNAPTIVEIGFGMGHSLIEMAKTNPQNNYIGIEVHQAGIGSLSADLHDNALSNVRIAPYDAVTVFEQAILDESLAGIQIFFPDPWPKKKHHKRRLIQQAFVDLLVKKLQPGGFLHVATDWEHYAHHALEVLTAHRSLVNQAGANQFSPRPTSRPLTKFEQRGELLGHSVFDLLFTKNTHVSKQHVGERIPDIK
jgi:tRNA (guanine-N7-)-methyltransferase